MLLKMSARCRSWQLSLMIKRNKKSADTDQQGTETKKSRIRGVLKCQSLLTVAVCIEMEINEDWIIGNKYLYMEE